MSVQSVNLNPSMPLALLKSPGKNAEGSNVNEQLRTALRSRDFVSCYALIERGADPHYSLNILGQNLLTEALQREDLPACKFLFDFGVRWDEEDREKIEELLSKKKLESSVAKEVFARRPPPNKPQIFWGSKCIEEGFYSLEDIVSTSPSALSNLTKEIILFNVADEDFDNPNYGSITEKFLKSMNSTLYVPLSKNFTVIRNFVNRRSQLSAAPKIIRKLLPHLRFALWILAGHSLKNSMDLSTTEELTICHGKDMKQTAKALDPSTLLSLWGCKCGQGDKGNLAHEFSLHSEGRIVFASEYPVETMDLELYIDPTSGKTGLIPYFEDEGESTVKAYAAGKILLSDTSENHEAIVETVTKHHRKQVNESKEPS